MTEPQRDHVKRPDLPWRVATLTECGRPATGPNVITRDQLLTRLRKDGQQRTAILTCMTCWQTSSRWSTFEVNPSDAMRREVYAHRTDDQLNAELRALAALAVAHRDEFDQYIAGLAETVDITQLRRNRRRA